VGFEGGFGKLTTGRQTNPTFYEKSKVKFFRKLILTSV
jgi:hypothetical protein